jgi:hypothetical protein
MLSMNVDTAARSLAETLKLSRAMEPEAPTKIHTSLNAPLFEWAWETT